MARQRLNCEQEARFLRITLDERHNPGLAHCRNVREGMCLVCATYRVIVLGWKKPAAARALPREVIDDDHVWYKLVRCILNLDTEDLRRRIGLASDPDVASAASHSLFDEADQSGTADMDEAAAAEGCLETCSVEQGD